jgi:hypothetical protein
MPQPQPPGNMNTWAQSMERRMETQREALRLRDPNQVADDSGAKWNATDETSGTLTMTFINIPINVSVPDYVVFDLDGKEAPTMTQGLVISYLMDSKGIGRAGKWIAFRELPDGLFYHQAFDGYTGGALAKALGDDLEGFKRGAKTMGGGSLTGFGDAAFEFQVLPRLWVAVTYWLGDDEDGFPPNAKVLFDQAASSYLITDGLAILCSQLTRRIMRGAQAEQS